MVPARALARTISRSRLHKPVDADAVYGSPTGAWNPKLEPCGLFEFYLRHRDITASPRASRVFEAEQNAGQARNLFLRLFRLSVAELQGFVSLIFSTVVRMRQCISAFFGNAQTCFQIGKVAVIFLKILRYQYFTRARTLLRHAKKTKKTSICILRLVGEMYQSGLRIHQ